MPEPQRERMNYVLLEALRNGAEEAVRAFFPQDNADEAGGRRWRGVTVGGNSALHIAADFRHLELASLICARDSSLLVVRNAALETPVHCAARAGADRIVTLFTWEACRCEEAVLRATDREGKTALHAAAQEGHVKVAEVLMSADPGLAAIDDNNGVSPLYAAVLSGSPKLVQVLIGSHADGGDRPEASYAGPNGQTALHAAAMISLGAAMNGGVGN
ncbi:Protein ACCELERATED CELL DEATH 6 [Ananas comosus]|uniref:Protein ACCELERATED CELL DEATH 6 n=1 Tax=Ananas comosus TaxID=4615 RepID=A0A199UUM2_ANACO|nr:Protein ACCELERATED CELL DEATH 6 [Ananas comosus]